MSKSDSRMYLGFEGKHGREFTMKTTDDANPFRYNMWTDIIFGDGGNVRDPTLNDPRNPQMDETELTGAYIRIEQKETDEQWKIASAQVFINERKTPAFYLKLTNIVLGEETGKKVYLEKIVD